VRRTLGEHSRRVGRLGKGETVMSHTSQVRRVATLVAGILVAAVVLVETAQAAGATPQWKRALAVRSNALDRQYGLGRFAVPASAGTSTPPAWMRALESRGQAMNAKYHLGADRVAVSSALSNVNGGFDWRDAGIGAAFSAAVLLLLGSIAYASRARVRLARMS
jgi:hypothetical protein